MSGVDPGVAGVYPQPLPGGQAPTTLDAPLAAYRVEDGEVLPAR